MRADASPAIGTGHVRRCLAIAESLKSRGASVHFITRPQGEYSASLFGGSEIPVSAVTERSGPGATDDGLAPEVDAAATLAAIGAAGVRPDWLIVDHYALDRQWEREMRARVGRIFVFDDLADRCHDCDVLLDPNLYQDGERRYQGRVPEDCRLLLGPRYAVLRDEFRRARIGARSRTGDVRRILVFFGGGPLAAVCTMSAIEALGKASVGGAEVDVVFNADQRDREMLAAACEIAGFRFHFATTRMAELMSAADLAIGAGGTSLWERCCVGLPCIALALAVNQRQQVRDAAAAGLVIASASPADQPGSLAQEVVACVRNPAQLVAVSERAMAVVDGRGNERVLRSMGIPSVEVREAVNADCRPMFRWRNEPEVRNASRSTAPIELSSHEAWFASALVDRNKLLLIGESDGRPIGVVRFDIGGESAEVSIYLLAGETGRGLGAELLVAAEERLAAARPGVKCIRAEVLADNRPSHALFRASGYACSDSIYSKRVAR